MAAARLGAMAGLWLALAGGGPPGFAADAGAPLVLEKTIPLKDVSGRIDHMAIDLMRHRLSATTEKSNAWPKCQRHLGPAPCYSFRKWIGCM